MFLPSESILYLLHDKLLLIQVRLLRVDGGWIIALSYRLTVLLLYTLKNGYFNNSERVAIFKRKYK